MKDARDGSSSPLDQEPDPLNSRKKAKQEKKKEKVSEAEERLLESPSSSDDISETSSDSWRSDDSPDLDRSPLDSDSCESGGSKGSASGDSGSSKGSDISSDFSSSGDSGSNNDRLYTCELYNNTGNSFTGYHYEPVFSSSTASTNPQPNECPPPAPNIVFFSLFALLA